MRQGILASLNERIDFDTAAIVAEDLGFLAQPLEGSADGSDEEVQRLEAVMSAEDEADLVQRPPVIVVMGHVDHGKTKLLDAVRKTNVVDSERGGITQHIGAYQVERNDHLMTFIDTPGHEAFTVMRSRGAKVADIAILVVAADDGIQPQTKEAIDIIKASKLPFVVAINKIDVAGANVERVKGQLAEVNFVPEDWGGKTICVPMSAKTGENVDQLLDMLVLVADLAKDDIRANPDRLAIGTIIESHVDKGEGAVATVLVQTGELKVGDAVGLRGVNYGKVRAMRTWDGQTVKTAAPSTPVKILGLKDAPSVGDILEVPENPKSLEKVKFKHSTKSGVAEISVKKTVSVDDDEDEKPVLNVIVKADVLGSLEAVIGMIEKIDNPYVDVKVVAKGLGNVTDADMLRAEAAEARVYAFNVRLTGTAETLARDKDLSFERFEIIYRLHEDMEERVKALVPKEKVYTELGSLRVLAVFGKLEKGVVIGGQVLKGTIERGAVARVIREEKILGEGLIETLQAGKVDVKDVEQGQECGIGFTTKTKVEVGDTLEIYKEEEIERK